MRESLAGISLVLAASHASFHASANSFRSNLNFYVFVSLRLVYLRLLNCRMLHCAVGSVDDGMQICSSRVMERVYGQAPNHVQKRASLKRSNEGRCFVVPKNKTKKRCDAISCTEIRQHNRFGCMLQRVPRLAGSQHVKKANRKFILFTVRQVTWLRSNRKQAHSFHLSRLAALKFIEACLQLWLRIFLSVNKTFPPF